MGQYQEVYDRFEWTEAWAEFEGVADGQFNLGHEIVARHIQDGFGNELAIRTVDIDSGSVEELSYRELDRRDGLSTTFGI